MEEQKAGTLTWGILSLVFAETGLLGLIFAIIGKNKAKKHIAAGNQLVGADKVGSILSTVGLILSIIMIAYWAIFIIAFIAGVLGNL